MGGGRFGRGSPISGINYVEHAQHLVVSVEMLKLKCPGMWPAFEAHFFGDRHAKGATGKIVSRFHCCSRPGIRLIRAGVVA